MSAFANQCDGVEHSRLEEQVESLERHIESLERHIDELAQESDAYLENLTATQARCTALVEENRQLRRVAGTKPSPSLLRVLADIFNERERQDAKWGAIGTTHKQKAMAVPFGTGSIEQSAAAGAAKAQCDIAFAHGEGTWCLVLAEEVAEALAESDPDKLRRELIECAAVCCKMVEMIDRGKTE